MASSLSNLADNHPERIHELNVMTVVIFLNMKTKNNLINYKKCLFYNDNYLEKLNEELKEKLKNTFNFSNNDFNKFILLLRKGVYPYKYMDDWKKFNETTLPGKREIHSNLNLNDIIWMQKEFVKTLK